MKLRTLKSINKRLSQFYTELHKVAMVYCEYDLIVDADNLKPQKRMVYLQDHLAECFYEEEDETRWLNKAKRAAKKCGLKLIGAGRSRLAVVTTYYSKKIVIKLSALGGNVPEWKAARKMSKGLKRVALTPSFYWDNNLWGLVLAFPYAPIIKNGNWDADYAMDEEWGWSDLPKKYHTKKFADRLCTMNMYSRDAHVHNIGVMNGMPYLIDYDVK